MGRSCRQVVEVAGCSLSVGTGHLRMLVAAHGEQLAPSQPFKIIGVRARL